MRLQAPPWEFFVVKWLIRGLLSIRGREVEGLGNIPPDGPLIIAANHISNMDGPFLGVTVNLVRYMQGLGKEELFSIPLLGTLLRRWGMIPVSRVRGDVRALRAVKAVLAQEGCILFFPEGTRYPPGRPGRPKAGVGLMARETGVPVLPARVINTERWWGKDPVRVCFGTPLRYEEDGTRQGDRRFAQKVMDEIFKL